MEEKVYYYNRQFLDQEPESISTSYICAKVWGMKMTHTYWDALIEIKDDENNLVSFDFNIELSDDDFRSSLKKMTRIRNTLNDVLEGVTKAREDYLKEKED